MADHDYVCGASGLTIGYQKVRVLLLVEKDYEDFGLEGRLYTLAPAIKAEWDRDGNTPDKWDERGLPYRLAHDALKLGLSEGRGRKMEELLERLPGGLTMRRIDYARKEHPDSYKVKLGKMRAAPWVPTPKRVTAALKAAGFKACATKVSYGNVRVKRTGCTGEEGRELGWYDEAAAAVRANGFRVDLNNEPTYGGVLVVRPPTLPLTLDDVRNALLSGGWPEGDPSRAVEEPVFTDTVFKYKDKEFVTSAAKNREYWLSEVKGHGFRVEKHGHGFRVFHCVNGKDDPEAKSIESYYSRLRCCGIACAPEGLKELEGRFGRVAVGAIVVPEQERSFEALVTQRRVRFMDNMADQYKRRLHHRTRRFVTWAVIREDVWQGLLKTRSREVVPVFGYRPGNDGLFESRKAACVRAFDKMVDSASHELERKAGDEGYVWGTVERALDAGGRDYDVETAVWQDPPFRVGLKWCFCHLAVLLASKQITREQADAAVQDFAELSHVRSVLADLEHQWQLPHSGYQDPAHDVMAKVRSDWAELTREDDRREKARRAKWDK